MEVQCRRERLLHCKSKQQKLRIQQRNQQAVRQLHVRLGFLSMSCGRQQHLLDRRICQLRDDMCRRSEVLTRDAEETDDWQDVRSKSAPISFGLEDYGDAVVEPVVRSACQYGAVGCSSFPCLRPASYTNIGFDVRTDGPRASPRYIESTAAAAAAAAARGGTDLLRDVEARSVRRPLRTSCDQTVGKERSLKKIIAEMKVRSVRDQPPDWCVNYGRPTPRRKLLTAARPPSSDYAGV